MLARLSTMAASTAYSVRSPSLPARWPYTPRDFQRMDESTDDRFYSMPRFVTHIDERAIDAYGDYLASVLPAPSDANPPRLLDLCSSWISMLPASFTRATAHVTGVGMNKQELEANPVLSAWRAHDLNADPTLSEPDASIDAVVCAVSIDYLTRPREILGEVARVLKPGSSVHLAFSNRCFPTKVIGRWLQVDEDERCNMVAAFLHHAAGSADAPGSLFEQIEAVTVLERSRADDPLYVVRARRRSD